MAKRNSIIAGAVVILVAVAGAAGWLYFRGNSVDLMTPSPLGENSLGKDDAPVTIIEYASATCPYCARVYQTTFPELKKRYIDTGQVRFIFREFPLNDVDMFAFMLTRCASKGDFFPFLDALFQQQEKWAVSSPLPPLTEIAKQFGFSEESIQACGRNKKVLDGVLWSSNQGVKLGVDSTPTFFVNGKMYTGEMSIGNLEKLIAPYLKPKG